MLTPSVEEQDGYVPNVVYTCGAIRHGDQIAIDPAVPSESPIRAGQALFVTQCMVCPTLNGAGSAEVGPDLNLPRNPTEYLQPWALKSLIRDPSSVRRWPDMRMTGFDETALPEADLDRVVAYLAHMAGRKER